MPGNEKAAFIPRPIKTRHSQVASALAVLERLRSGRGNFR